MSRENLELFSSPETWLLNLGYISENAEQNLLLYGYISSRGVVNVELLIDVADWLIKYAIILDTRSYRRFKLQRWLEGKSGLFFKVVLYLFLKVFGSYNPSARISRCVRDYAGKQWKTQVEVMNVKQYNKIAVNSGTETWIYKDGITKNREVCEGEGSSTASTTSM